MKRVSLPQITIRKQILINKSRYVFSQLCDFLPIDHFKWSIKKYEGSKYVKSSTCWNHLIVPLFGQLSSHEGLRDLIAIIAPFKSAFHHLGFEKNVSRSNLSKANEMRKVRIFQEFVDEMVSIAREKRGVVRDFFISNNVYVFGPSTTSLCFFVYWWAKLHHGKGGVKLHEPYDVKTDIPTFSVITDASIRDSQAMEPIPHEEESFYIFDRVYMATKKLYIIEEAEAYFIVREERKMSFEVIEDREYNNSSSRIMVDQIIRFKGHKTKRQYPSKLRRVAFYDYDGNRTFVFYTNNFEVTTGQVAMLYKYRWRVKLFPKWLKQHLRIKEFYGTSENAVKIQIYAPIIVCCLVVIVQECMGLKLQTHDVLRILSTASLTKMSLYDLLTKQKEEESTEGRYQQLCLNFNR